MRCNPILAALLLPVLLSACAGAAEGYPSLAIRPAERQTGQWTPPPAYVPPAPASTTLASLEALAAEARSAHAAFTTEAARATRTVVAARGATSGEAWARAEVARASLAAARSRTLVPLASIDRLYVDASNAGEDLNRLAAVLAEVEALAAEEDRVLADLAR
ncbi:hypothetical protein V5740_01735 [Croceibacterium sp. TMG7-5b_MA50]|uniref:hypothetical protein n=1 Tax=Croceibacterium sp. TMG7-5b_MA50 TaxID=3121290 RepID=UPI0032215653